MFSLSTKPNISFFSLLVIYSLASLSYGASLSSESMFFTAFSSFLGLSCRLKDSCDELEEEGDDSLD